MSNIWFKDLSKDSWLSRDEKLDAETGRETGEEAGEEGEPAFRAPEDWLAAVRGPRLADAVPNEVMRIYEVARGAALYGYFFHPLMTLAERELFRAAEAAVRLKFLELDMAPPGAQTQRIERGSPHGPGEFRRMVDFLVSRGVIAEEAAASWRAITKSWKVVSHPEDAALFSLAAVLSSLRRFAELIDALYRR